MTLITLSAPDASALDVPAAPAYEWTSEIIEKALAERMLGVSWQKGCPVKMRDLRLVRVKHFDLKEQVVWGELIVHKKVARQITRIFRDLYNAGFPIEKMTLVHNYGGSDDRSMADNNTSAFNCRAITGKPGTWSKHSYGIAIDINPRFNPYIVKGKVSPPQAEPYVDRKRRRPGMFHKGFAAYKAFVSRGWKWGGNWRAVKDYHHFELPKKALK